MFFVLLLTAVLQQPPVPQPFPRPGTAQPAQPGRPAPPPTPPSTVPPTPPNPGAAPTEAMLGVPIYPGAQFITSYDAGRGQRYYIFGSAASFVDLVTYYRTTLKQKGELVFDVPARDDGVSAGRDDQGLPVGRVAGLSESEAGRTTSPLSDAHSDRSSERKTVGSDTIFGIRQIAT